jgi:hypothetical protein
MLFQGFFCRFQRKSNYSDGTFVFTPVLSAALSSSRVALSTRSLISSRETDVWEGPAGEGDPHPPQTASIKQKPAHTNTVLIKRGFMVFSFCLFEIQKQ